MAARRSTRAKLRRLRWWFGKNKYDLSFLWINVGYSSIDKMAKYDWNTFRNCVAFLAGGVAPGTRRPHHDSELTSCHHDVFLTWRHYHNNIVLFYHNSPITRSHFMDPTDRAIKGFYCTSRRSLIQHVATLILMLLKNHKQNSSQPGNICHPHHCTMQIPPPTHIPPYIW